MTEITSEFVWSCIRPRPRDSHKWSCIRPRPRDSHKGTFGSVLALAGSARYRGAALLAAEGALRAGAGLVTLASVEPVLAAASARLPECCLLAGSARYRGAALLAAEGALRAGAGLVTLASVEPVLAAASARLPECCLLPCIDGAEGGISPESLSLLRRQKAAVLLAGPGLGYTAQSTARAAETRTLIQQLLSGFAGCAVLDADGLNAAAGLLSAGQPLPHPAGALVLTPHPGEMARLTGLSTGAAGLVTLASVEPVLAAASARLPECCLLPCIDGAEGGISPESLSLLRRQKAAVLLAGPGLGYTAQSTARAAETRTLIQQLLSGFAGCAVLDADGLNAAAGLLSAGQPLPHPAGALVLTPHPGEMARLTGLSTGAVNADREGIAPPLCAAVGRRGAAERDAHHHCRPGWPLFCEPHRQPGPGPGRQRGRAGRHPGSAAGLRTGGC